ncbi:hypothetical protein KC939_00345 [Candidatus Saccharibacteria bacterium]|nr:hypothetical protein [Candidatus Saccharibacteria bacterium]
MKKTDIAMIILIASLSAMFAYFIAQAVIGEPKQEATQVKTVETMTSEIEEPSSDIFNKNAINPTVERETGQSANNLPF